jgi:two-component system, response regulator PdtaR
MRGQNPKSFTRRNKTFPARLASVEDRIEMARLSPLILIVEDEFLLRMDSAEVIENAGFEVIQAADADEAIAILTARPDIHVVFTDIQMPGSMDGLKLARFVRTRWPPIKIVATSGLVRVEDDDLPAGSVFLPKPYRGADVVAALRELTGMA